MFKKGDRVKLIDSTHFRLLHNGDIGIVVEDEILSRDMIIIKWLTTKENPPKCSGVYFKYRFVKIAGIGEQLVFDFMKD